MEGILAIVGGRTAIIGLTVVGMAICTRGVGKIAQSGEWLSASGMLGIGLGVIALLISGMTLLGKPLPFIASEQAALIAIIAIMAVKLVIAAAFRLV